MGGPVFGSKVRLAPATADLVQIGFARLQAAFYRFVSPSCQQGVAMKVHSIGERFLLVFWLVLIAIPVVGQEAGITAVAPTDVSHLELGDDYQVVVRRDGAEARFSGRLVQMTHEWLVLRMVSECRNEQGVPVLSKVPYVKRHFRNVGIGRTTTDRWVPRAATTVVGRLIHEDKEDFQQLATTQPTWEQVTRVEYAEAGEIAHCSGPLTLEGTTLHGMKLVCEEMETPLPILGQLPGFGNLFTTTEVELREETRELALESVLVVEEPLRIVGPESVALELE